MSLPKRGWHPFLFDKIRFLYVYYIDRRKICHTRHSDFSHHEKEFEPHVMKKFMSILLLAAALLLASCGKTEPNETVPPASESVLKVCPTRTTSANYFRDVYFVPAEGAE